MNVNEILFWSAVGVILYTYIGFPLLSWLRSWMCRRPHTRSDVTPTVSVLIAAHNEEDSIGDKVRNMLALDYPGELVQIVVASDGSSDRTIEILKTFDEPRLTVLNLPRAGKAAALNASVEHCTGEILVFSDANSMFGKDALTALVRPFADPTVGGVAGDQRYSKGDSQSTADAGERHQSADEIREFMQKRGIIFPVYERRCPECSSGGWCVHFAGLRCDDGRSTGDRRRRKADS